MLEPHYLALEQATEFRRHLNCSSESHRSFALSLTRKIGQDVAREATAAAAAAAAASTIHFVLSLYLPCL